ncbi:MAG: universal stress protein [Chloroflexi bacterium]|nr:universal stress protein [Chloroflexota bacterium]
MRVLLATDGSASADRARDLVAGLAWPDGTIVRVLVAVDTHLEMLAAPFAVVSGDVVDELDSELVTHARVTLEAAETALREAGLATEAITRRERAADAIIDEARAWAADLVVLGNRGHTTLTSMVLGSTSAEVVDHAPCPVLVARAASIGELVLASDGSPSAIVAERLLTGWPMFRGFHTTVVSVALIGPPWSPGLASGLYDPVATTDERGDAAARSEVIDLAETVARRLRDAGIDATARPMEGDAASEILTVARGASRPLIVMGSRGHTGIARLLLGGVARNVLHHATGSVLIVRQGVRVAPAEPAVERAAKPGQELVSSIS